MQFSKLSGRQNMNSSNLSWLGTAATKMDWATARQKTLAENIANADTPGYVGKDVDSFASHLEKTMQSGRANPDAHIAENSWGGSFDGNKVVIEEQALLSSQTSSEFALASKMYRKAHQLIALSIGRK